MARQARMKVKGQGMYYHVMNRLAGPKEGHWPLTDVDKEKGFELIQSACRYFLIEPIAMTFMGNHFHLVVYVPSEAEMPSDQAVGERYNAFYAGKKCGKFGIGNTDEPERLAKVKAEMVDLSLFMKWFSQVYTRYYNRANKLRGRLWADRFKSVLLDRNGALWNCVKYVELNPVRANLTEDAADYRFCSWGRYKGSGVHPFAANFEKHLGGMGERFTVGAASEANASLSPVPALRASQEQLYLAFEAEMVRTVLTEKTAATAANEAAIESEVKAVRAGQRKESMPLRFLRRTRHWTDGAIIGSKAFVQETACLFREKESVLRHKLSRGMDASAGSGSAVYCFRRLREMS